MAARGELGEAWGLLLSAFSGGMAWAMTGRPGLGLAVGAAVYGVKVVTGALTGRSRRSSGAGTGRELPVTPRSEEAHWLRRAEAAERAFADVASSVRAGPIAERVAGFGAQTDETFATLRRIAGQASTVGTALARMDPRRLAMEQDRIAQALAGTEDPVVRAERERALAAVHAQLDAYRRLASARATLLARLESGTLSLEGLVARLAEVVALTETASASASADNAARVDSLAIELEGLRAGLTEAETASARVLGGVTGLPGVGTDNVARAEGGERRPQTFPPRP